MNNSPKIGMFHHGSGVAQAWNLAEGILRTLKRMGFTVYDFGHPGKNDVSIDLLNTLDLILCSGPEWYIDVLKTKYPRVKRNSKTKIVAWYHESAYRDDRNFYFGSISKEFDINFYPAIQDAEEFAGNFLPFGVDTTIFRPSGVEKSIDVAFLGSLYGKRSEYIKQIKFPITFIPPVAADTPEKSSQLIADVYSSIRIFVNLPSLSQLIVTKVTEVMACNTLVIQPHINHPSAVKNESFFKDHEDLIYYPPNNPNSIIEILGYLNFNPTEIARIADNGFKKVTSMFTLELQLKQILNKAGIDIPG